MKSIVVGFTDAAGRSEPKVVCGPEVSDQAQAKLFFDAKRKHRFPKGTVRLELCFFEEERTVIAVRLPSAAPAESK